MYRTAANRLLHSASLIKNSGGGRLLRFPILRTVISSSRFSTTADPQTVPNQTLNPSDSSTSSSSTAGDGPRLERKNPRADYEEEQARMRLGWSEEAMIAGAKEVGVSPSIVGSFPRKEAALVEFFMDDCLQKLMDRIDSEEESQHLIPSQRISKLARIRLEMQAPYISKWPQALSIQAHPLNVPTSFKQRALLVDEIWHAAGDEAFDVDWYVKRTVLGGIHSTAEIYMLTDSSPEFRDTWLFLDDRVKDAFDLKKTIQEAKYLAEAVGAGMGSSLQRFVGRVLQR
ncbi:ubiquinone biosynthesis protein COQ9, mitochondrial-like isoform X2 [Durio zibethinus]|uniref:Ubiquinone biosynthesis protein n=1 Tax=Durio zibethinus TaxID=66656 RepID=A0A6P5ZC82_DURZI|nr:ubiquinone biosynthesis protein COQ9, mitochondrial-like isoform X2 [Durio zibethinus]